MLDLLLTGAEIIDGSGGQRFRADLGVRDGRIVALGRVSESARRRVDAEGRVLTPGIIDIHTHYDAQAFWDGTLSPSPLHGVTSVVGGNCGFSIAPLVSEQADYIMRMLARVEGMPLEALQAGVPWDWSSTDNFLRRLEGTLSVNAGFMVGHSAIRRVVMGEAASSTDAPSEEQIRRMSEYLRTGLEAGGLGFSSSWGEAHNDSDGNPVPSRYAGEEELVTLCEVTGRHRGTSLEFIPTLSPFEERHMSLMARMSARANRPLNWNALGVTAASVPFAEERLYASDYAEARGGRVVALTIPMASTMRMSFMSANPLDALPGWIGTMTLPPPHKLAALSDPATRRHLRERAEQATTLRQFANWGDYTIVETFTDETARYEGQLVADIASNEGRDPFDVLLDAVVADDLRTAFRTPVRGDDLSDWEARVALWRDKRAVIGASDAGAHLDRTAQFSYPTEMIANAVRRFGLLSLEEAVYLMTDVPARLYGLQRRGRLREGWHADIVILDPDSVGALPLEMRFDLPAGAGRLYAGATGIDRVFVNGVEILDHGVFTPDRPGQILRSGRDTDMVEARRSDRKEAP